MFNAVAVDPLLWLQLMGFLALALAGQALVRRFQQPLLLGEILIGIAVRVLADVFLPSGSAPFQSTLITTLGFLGAVILLFTVGLETDLREIYTGRNLAVALGGVLVPWLGGFALANWVFGALFTPSTYLDPSTNQTICYYCTPASAFAAKVFVGSTMVATSVAVTAAVLHEMGRMRGPVAGTIIGAAVVDDVLGMIVLAISVGISQGDLQPLSILLPILYAAAFVGIAMTLGMRYLGRIVTLVEARARRMGLPHTGFLTALAITFLMAFLSELVGLSPIIGAFMAGAIFSRLPAREYLRERAEGLRAILAPLFFVSIGLLANVYAFADPTYALFLVGVTVVAFATKFIGCALPAHLGGVRGRRAAAVGVGMIPRGEVALIIALYAFGGAIIGPRIYTTMVVMAILTSLVPPVLLKRLLKSTPEAGGETRPEPRAVAEPEGYRPSAPSPFRPPPRPPPGS